MLCTYLFTAILDYQVTLASLLPFRSPPKTNKHQRTLQYTSQMESKRRSPPLFASFTMDTVSLTHSLTQSYTLALK